jgi:hypothetical protein
VRPEYLDWPLLALQPERRELVVLDPVERQLGGAVAEDVVGCSLHESRGKVDGVANDGEVATLRASDRSAEDAPRRDADRGPE